MRQQDPYLGRDLLDGQFKVLERIGAGGMGAVYKAQQPSMDRFVAVKILHAKFTNRKDLISRFRREARAMSHLTHPNTAKVFLYGQLEDNACYIVMEYLEGRNLNQIVRQDGPMAPLRAFAVLIQACGALEEAHQKGIIHRDLKPENIFLCSQGGIVDFVKVLDFGLAKVTEREMLPGSLILTQEGMVFGTPEFMSPEQAQGKALEARSDVYSLAVILYELVTGKLPFDARSAMEFISLHVQSPPIPLSKRAPDTVFPRGFQEVINHAMAKRPEDRFQSAAEFATALAGLGGGDQDIAQAMSSIPASAFAATQPTRPALKTDRTQEPPDPRAPGASSRDNGLSSQGPSSGGQSPEGAGGASMRGSQGSGQGDTQSQPAVGRHGLPMVLLIAIGVVIGLTLALGVLYLTRP